MCAATWFWGAGLEAGRGTAGGCSREEKIDMGDAGGRACLVWRMRGGRGKSNVEERRRIRLGRRGQEDPRVGVERGG